MRPWQLSRAIRLGVLLLSVDLAMSSVARWRLDVVPGFQFSQPGVGLRIRHMQPRKPGTDHDFSR
jgi:hypothetical protein